MHLPLGDHVHQLDATEQDARTAKVLEAKHRSSQALDSPMVLLNNVVQVLDLPKGDWGLPVRR
jgi:hypothetical protein